MAIISDDPALWPIIDSYRVNSYFVVAASAMVIYDWALAFGREVELIWRRPWSLMTVLYLSVRYAGIPYYIFNVLSTLPSVSLSDAVRVSEIFDYFVGSYNDSNSCNKLGLGLSWMGVALVTTLGVISITRLYAMYMRSRKILIFLVVTFLAVTITCGVSAAMGVHNTIGEELTLSGVHGCAYEYEGDYSLLIIENYAIVTAWELMALSLAAWIAVKHFYEQQRSSTGWTASDCFTVLIKTHVLYFIAFAATSCFNLGLLSPIVRDSWTVGSEMYIGALEVMEAVRTFVLGPRLILSIREFHADLVSNSDEGTAMTSIAFNERRQILTDTSV